MEEGRRRGKRGGEGGRREVGVRKKVYENLAGAENYESLDCVLTK